MPLLLGEHREVPLRSKANMGVQLDGLNAWSSAFSRPVKAQHRRLGLLAIDLRHCGIANRAG